jgi:hypothetical protein
MVPEKLARVVPEKSERFIKRCSKIDILKEKELYKTKQGSKEAKAICGE